MRIPAAGNSKNFGMNKECVVPHAVAWNIIGKKIKNATNAKTAAGAKA
jgi:hypothetical protein